MDRRKFLYRVTAASTAAASLEAATGAGAAGPAGETRVVTWRLSGFTCITCSVGLEVMLRGLRGVTRATSSYPASNVTIGFDGHITSDEHLKQFISACGFSVV